MQYDICMYICNDFLWIYFEDILFSVYEHIISLIQSLILEIDKQKIGNNYREYVN